MSDTGAPSSAPEQIKPEDCPEPFWHKTGRYCPACSWIEPSCGAVAVYSRDALSESPPYLGDWRAKQVTCTLPPDHEGLHEAKVNW